MPASWQIYRDFLHEPDTVDSVNSDAGDRLRINFRRIADSLRARGVCVTDAPYSATGDGVTLDAAAINLAMSDLSEEGGGTVMCPPGDYAINAATLALLAKSNVTLYGQEGATLKIADGTGTFHAMITQGVGRLSNFKIFGFGFDWNGAGNPTADVRTTGNHSCTFVFLNNFNRVTIENCEFDYSGVWAISCYTSAGAAVCRGAVVRNNQFNFTRQTNPSPTTPDYDTTTVYLDCANHEASGNHAYAALAAGARGFIESHSGPGVIKGNQSDGFKTCVSVVSAAQTETDRSSNDIAVTGNTASNTLFGFELWSVTGYALRNVTIAGNSIGVSNAAWNYAACSGIRFARAADGTLEGTFKGITITGNTISFESEGAGRSTFTNPLTGVTGAVEPGNQTGIAANPWGDVTGLTITDNTIIGAPAIGIEVGQDSYRSPTGNTTIGARVANNVIIDAGSNKSNVNGYRIGIRIAGTQYGCTYKNNTIQSTDASTLTGFYAYVTNVLGGANVKVRDNDISAVAGTYATLLLDAIVDVSTSPLALATITTTLDFPSVNGGSSTTLTATATGAAVGDIVVVQTPSGFDSRFNVYGVVNTANNVVIVAYNPTAGALDPASGSFRILIIKP